MSFIIREIEENDFDNGFFETLSNLSTVGGIKTNEVLKKEIIKEIITNNDYIIIISEDTESREVIGTATLFIEQKFIHNGGKVGHIEDVATRKGYEGRGIGKEIINKLITISRERGCYKIILDCDEKVSKFYEKIGFKKKAIMLRFDL
ncbi:MAG TPA: GNAT family N-acetyltransferase [Candidatus Nitrosocosmicus sp.]|nr:GNAT family N-acetyltransferase [Candidatus Nitrosocosmicus sp.]